MNKFTIENKPHFDQDELRAIDMGCLGFPEGTIYIGKIVGRSIVNIIDNWLVEFKVDFAPNYPYRVVAIPHTFFLTRNITNEEFHQFQK